MEERKEERMRRRGRGEKGGKGEEEEEEGKEETQGGDDVMTRRNMMVKRRQNKLNRGIPIANEAFGIEGKWKEMVAGIVGPEGGVGVCGAEGIGLGLIWFRECKTEK